MRSPSSRLWRLIARPAVRIRPGRRCRPSLELLEDRATPALFQMPAIPHSVARDDWTDTDGTNPVQIAILANDSTSQPTNSAVKLLPATIMIRALPAHGRV